MSSTTAALTSSSGLPTVDISRENSLLYTNIEPSNMLSASATTQPVNFMTACRLGFYGSGNGINWFAIASPITSDIILATSQGWGEADFYASHKLAFLNGYYWTCTYNHTTGAINLWSFNKISSTNSWVKSVINIEFSYFIVNLIYYDGALFVLNNQLCLSMMQNSDGSNYVLLVNPVTNVQTIIAPPGADSILYGYYDISSANYIFIDDSAYIYSGKNTTTSPITRKTINGLQNQPGTNPTTDFSSTGDLYLYNPVNNDMSIYVISGWSLRPTAQKIANLSICNTPRGMKYITNNLIIYGDSAGNCTDGVVYPNILVYNFTQNKLYKSINTTLNNVGSINTCILNGTAIYFLGTSGVVAAVNYNSLTSNPISVVSTYKSSNIECSVLTADNITQCSKSGNKDAVKLASLTEKFYKNKSKYSKGDPNSSIQLAGVLVILLMALYHS
jgi:hypothetical protein